MPQFETQPTEIAVDENGQELFREPYDLERLFRVGQTRADHGIHYEVVSQKADFANGVINTVLRKTRTI